ncbi:LysR family transcriptional regulator [Microbacterium betulae]|uniref:LysR family transcriptional regulator n=1 Tax=Microbacterium betulae TaxID=2981139 RepID=A0AA97FIJ2_9MICO|nr:LysR family transcriptional regulator [Microbacterium sp. AB]WOF23563.1 LysR family transcriptional regulator [Microbacterium sp. AB]
MDLPRLRAILPLVPVLVAVGETEHVTAAAELLGMPQPNVSRAIRTLEQRLGAALVERHGRGVRLTPDARALLPAFRRALQELEEGVDTVTGSSAVTVALAFQTSLGERFIPEVLSEVRRDRPEIRFELHQGARTLLIDQLRGGRVALALVVDRPPLGDRVDVVPLFEQPLVALVPDGHPLAAHPSVSVPEIAASPIVTLAEGFGLRDSLDLLFARSELTPRIAFEGEDLITVRGLVTAGLGVAIMPEQPATPAGCVQVPIRSRLASRRMCAVTAEGESRPAVLFVRDVLVRIARERRIWAEAPGASR